MWLVNQEKNALAVEDSDEHVGSKKKEEFDRCDNMNKKLNNSFSWECLQSLLDDLPGV